jgi:hypothetical protein
MQAAERAAAQERGQHFALIFRERGALRFHQPRSEGGVDAFRTHLTDHGGLRRARHVGIPVAVHAVLLE